MQVVPFAFTVIRGRREGTKKTTHTDLCAAREKPIWFALGEVNRVRRFGAFSRGQTEKLPWVGVIAAELTEVSSGQDHRPQRVGLARESKARWCSPLFCLDPTRARTFRGPKSAARSIWTSHPMKWSWSLTALPRCGEPSARRIAGEVSEHGRMRPGADREARLRCLCSPYKRKADLCPENTQ